MIAREMEKKRIREELLTSGLLRRRELEAEVIREMMMEREIFTGREEGGGGRGLSLADSPSRSDGFGNYERLNELSRLECGINGRLSSVHRVSGAGGGKEERPATWLGRQEGGSDGNLASVLGCVEGGVLGGFPFQRQPEAAATRIVAEPAGVGEGQMVSVCKPMNSNVSGMKRKFEAPTKENGNGASSVNLNKKSLGEWSCALCQVTATCEQSLKDHLKGKKHMAKEKAMLISTKTVNLNANNYEASVEETNDLEAVDHETQQKWSEKQTEMELNTFWCATCKIGAMGEKQMRAHRRGKRHMTLLQKSGGGVVVIKTIPDNPPYVSRSNGAVAEEKEEPLCNSDEDADEAVNDESDAVGSDFEA
ncbi:UBP1-associated proteins 1C like [Actinidia chinensis var. chinensis]|uniref:UBP1-associated proteins 1C like n=1 Tax=Actinidia chinensis var. chinensis TaxID=1590841 RepID=A0A2R6Q2Y2_ACTCC|nr:UBP1-associated proteins 1C like [Actinidia chinensis var. chinensis]